MLQPARTILSICATPSAVSIINQLVISSLNWCAFASFANCSTSDTFDIFGSNTACGRQRAIRSRSSRYSTLPTALQRIAVRLRPNSSGLNCEISMFRAGSLLCRATESSRSKMIQSASIERDFSMALSLLAGR